MTYEERLSDAQGVYAEGQRRLKTIPEPEGQKFHIGQRVHVAEDLGSMMRHFPAGVNATVIGTYAHQYGGTDVKSYTLDIDDHGKVSWYREHQLTAIEPKP